MNTLVFMLVAILLPTWILGTLYLSFFPPSVAASGSSDSQLAANSDRATEPSALGDISESESDSQVTGDANAQNGDTQNGDTQGTSSSGGDFNPGQANIASGLTADQSAAYDEKNQFAPKAA